MNTLLDIPNSNIVQYVEICNFYERGQNSLTSYICMKSLMSMDFIALQLPLRYIFNIWITILKEKEI